MVNSEFQMDPDFSPSTQRSVLGTWFLLCANMDRLPCPPFLDIHVITRCARSQAPSITDEGGDLQLNDPNFCRYQLIHFNASKIINATMESA